MSGIRLELTGKRWQAIFTIRSHSIGYQTISYASKSHQTYHTQTINTPFLGLKSNSVEAASNSEQTEQRLHTAQLDKTNLGFTKLRRTRSKWELVDL